MPISKTTLDDLNKALSSYTKGELAPPTSVSTNLGKADGFIAKNADIISDVGLWDSKDYDKYKEYGVTLTRRKTQEQLDRERAQNQSWMEQTGNFIGQAVANEVVLGSVLGLSNLVDAAINIAEKEGENDYTNPISSWIEGLQEQTREKLEIYREDPSATFAVSDFGWWADNAVSIASSLSMMIPALGVTKGLSALGVLGKAGKISAVGRGLGKAAKATKLTKSAATFGKSVDAFNEIGLNALLSRTMENYQEARGVFQEVSDMTLNKIKSMSTEDKEKMISLNPELKGKSDEEMVHYIASVSADETFRNDYLMLLFDFGQFKAISSLWKGVASKAATRKLMEANKAAITGLNVAEGAVAKTPGFLKKRLDAISYAISNPTKSIAAIEWSEGIEEGYQGIQTEKGKEVAEKYLDPNFKARKLDDYLNDSAIWEQAFWGVLGGVGFQVAGTGLGNLAKKVKGKYNQGKLTDEEFALTQLSEEKIRENEITKRRSKLQDYVDKMQLVNEGYNPFSYEVDKKGEAVLKDGNKQFNKVETIEEIDLLKSQITDDFAANLAIDATDVGNYELLKEYVTDPNFNKYFAEAGLDNKVLISSLIEKMDRANDIYTEALHDILTNAEVENGHIAELAARTVARSKLQINSINNYINDIETAIDKDSDADTVTDDFINKIRAEYARDRLEELDNIESEYLVKNRKGELNDVSFNILSNRIKKKRKAILKQLNSTTNFFTNEDLKTEFEDLSTASGAPQFVEEFNKYYKSISKPNKEEAPKEELQKLVTNKVAYEVQLSETESIIPKTKEEYNQLYEEVAQENDFRTIEKYKEAVDKINSYLEKSEDLKAAQANLIEGNVSKELQDALDIIKVGSKNTNKYVTMLNIATTIIANDRKKAEEAAKVVIEDGQQVTPEQAEAVRAEVEEAQANISPSTGEQTQEETAEPSNVVKVDNPVEFVPETEITELTAPIDEVAKKQALADETAFVLNTDDQASIYAQRAVISLFRSDPSLFEGINAVDDTDANYNKLVSVIITKLAEEGVSAGIRRQAAEKGIKLAFDVRAIAMKNRNKTESDKFKRLAAEIAVKSTISTDGKMAAITKALTDEEFIKVVNEFIDSYIKANGLIANKNNKYYIDVVDLFSALLDNNNKQSYETAKFIFRNLKEFIIANRGKNFMFTNTSILNKHLNNPDTFIAALIEAKSTKENVDSYMHIAPATNKAPNYDKVVRSLKNGEEVTITDTGNSIDISKDGVQLGYITKVVSTPDNNGYRLAKADRGFVYNLSANPDGDINSNFDELFTDIINQESDEGKELFDLVQRFKANTTNARQSEPITGEAWKTIKNNSKFKALYDSKQILFPSSIKTDVQRANYVLKLLSNVILFNKNLTTPAELLHSYNNWKHNAYNNYKNTHTIQNKLKDTKGSLSIKIAGMEGGTLKYSSNNRDVSELGFVGTNNPIVVVTNGGVIVSEGSNKSYTNTSNFSVGTMGYLINDNANAPLVALITDTNPLSSNDALSKQVSDEITNLLNDYTAGKIGFDELGKAFQDLLGSFGADNHNNLFSGYSVIRDKGGNFIALNVQNKNAKDNGKYSLIINKKGKNGNDINIVFIDNAKNKSVRINSHGSKTINDIAKHITSRLNFNRTFFTVKNNNARDTNNNKYVYKKNGKLYVKIGGVETVYDNFADFSIKNNAFKTNQGGNATEGYYNTDSDIRSIYINVDSISSPVEGKQAAVDKKSPTNIIRSATKTAPVSTRDVLSAAGHTSEYIDALLGENGFVIPIVDKSIYYDSKATIAGAYYEDGKIYFTNVGSGKESINSPFNLVRLMVHESIHAKVASEHLFQGKEYLVNELMDTYGAFVEAVMKDQSKEGLAIRNWLEKSNFTPNQYFNSLPKADRQKWTAATEEQRRRQFAEEWLAESLSQPTIIKYLNTIQYREGVSVSNITEENKTIWQKIIDILAKLFDVDGGKVKDNTILAQQYSILGGKPDIQNNTTEQAKAENVPVDNTEKPNEATAEQVVEEVKEVKEDTNEEADGNIFERTKQSTRNKERKREKRDRSMAVTEIVPTSDEIYSQAYTNNNAVNPMGIKVVPDMNAFINQFDEAHKPLIASMIKNNEIKFHCE